MPDELFTFSAGKYNKNDHIDPHDDKAYVKVDMEDEQVVNCSREYAVIYYMTKNWQESYGGLLLDLETGK